MTVQQFRDLLRAQPFRAFRIVMSSGQTYDVRHPEAAFLTQTSIQVGIDIGDDGIPDDFRMCSFLNITAIEPLNVAEEAK
jgi:hypothetical protein